MSKIRIKNFGPIKEGMLDNDGWIDIKKVTVFIGNQGSGKSTVAKLISTFTWIEKALTRGDYDIKWFARNNRLKNQYLTYHRIENYLYDHGLIYEGSVIEYQGDAYNIKFEYGMLSISEAKRKNYSLPQIMYVPAERNFIANIKTPKQLRLTSDSLKEFLAEYDKAKNELKESMRLPINKVNVEYDKLNDNVNISGNDYKLKLVEASSGFQSLVPLYLVSWFLSHSVKKQSEVMKEPMSSEELERFKKGVAEIWSNDNLTDEQKRIALSVLSSKFNKTAFINIVEEPEQNLFPTSQQQILNSLLEFNNMNEGNKLIMTTHSPYLINYLTLAVEANKLIKKINTLDLQNKLQAIVPKNSTVDPKDLAIYQLDETDGSIKLLDNYNGLPSDENKLNENLAFSNDQFSELLDIEDLCR
jgi:predicted ATPase